MNRALIFANGDIHDGPMVRRALEDGRDALIIAADGGARAAQHFGLKVDVVIGDMDSLDADELDALDAAGAEVIRHSPEKDETDLELALYLAAERGAAWMRVIGGVGDRLDQTFGNVYLLGLSALADLDARLVAGKQETLLLRPGEYELHGAPGDTVSLIPVGGAVHGVRTRDLHYPLDDETLDFGPARGISNVMNADRAGITLRDGVLMIVHTVGRA